MNLLKANDLYEEIKEDLFNLSYPLNVFDLCEYFGIREIISEDLEDLDGCLLYGHTIAYNRNKPPHRIRFTILHELAHKLLNHHKQSGWSIRKQPPEYDKEANRLASYLLMPGDLVKKIVEKENFDFQRSVSYLSKKFDVSYSAAAKRYMNFHPLPCVLQVNGFNNRYVDYRPSYFYEQLFGRRKEKLDHLFFSNYFQALPFFFETYLTLYWPALKINGKSTPLQSIPTSSWIDGYKKESVFEEDLRSIFS